MMEQQFKSRLQCRKDPKTGKVLPRGYSFVAGGVNFAKGGEAVLSKICCDTIKSVASFPESHSNVQINDSDALDAEDPPERRPASNDELVLRESTNAVSTPAQVCDLVSTICITAYFGAKTTNPHYPLAKPAICEYLTQPVKGRFCHNSVMPYYPAGTLWDLVFPSRESKEFRYQRNIPELKKMSEKDAVRMILDIVLQLLGGVEHLNKHGVAHRDLSLSNVLMEWVDGKPFVKIFDFGHATTFYTERFWKWPLNGGTPVSVQMPFSTRAYSRAVGTTAFNSFEVLLQQHTCIDPQKVDVFSIGNIAMLLLSPFTQDSGVDPTGFIFASLDPATGKGIQHSPASQIIKTRDSTHAFKTFLSRKAESTSDKDCKESYAVLSQLCTRLLEEDPFNRPTAEDALNTVLNNRPPETVRVTIEQVRAATRSHSDTNGGFDSSVINSPETAIDFIKTNLPLATY